MAWVAALLPADHASAIRNRLTAIARGMQGHHEPRTLPQLKADTFTAGLLTTGKILSNTGDGTGMGGTDPGNGAGSPDQSGCRAEIRTGGTDTTTVAGSGCA